jgi:hypothetical protein
MDGFGQRVAGDLGPSERMQMAVDTHQRESPLAEHKCEAQSTGLVERRFGCGEAFAELMLLLPHRQLEMLEKVASNVGVTTGQLLRRLISIWLAGLDVARPAEDRALPDAGVRVVAQALLGPGGQRTAGTS